MEAGWRVASMHKRKKRAVDKGEGKSEREQTRGEVWQHGGRELHRHGRV